MAKIEVEIKLSKKLQYELTRIKKDVANVRRHNSYLQREHDKYIRNEVKLQNELKKKTDENKDLKLRVKTLLESIKPKKEILVEIKPEQAEILFMHLDYEVFILNDDNSESLIDPYRKDFSSKFVSEWWENKRFAIEAKTIPEVKS